MTSFRTYAILWVSGLIAGVVLVGRWRRLGQVLVPTEPEAIGEIRPATASTPVEQPHATPKTSTVVVAGAKADAERVQVAFTRIVSWTGSAVPSVAKLQHREPAATNGGLPQ